MKRKYLALTLIVFVVGLVGCAYNPSLVRSTHDMLQVSKVSYETAMKTAAGLHKEGRIDNEQKAEIIAVARAYMTAHNEAVETLAVYEETKNKVELDRLELMIVRASEALSEILKLVEKYLEGK